MEKAAIDLAAVRRCILFEGIAECDLKALLSCLGARRVRLGADGVLFRMEDQANRFGVLLSGSLVAVIYGKGGRRTIIKNLEAGSLVAAAQALSGVATMRVGVEASAQSEVLVLNVARVLSPCTQACTFHIRLVRNLMTALARKTLELNARIEILSHRSTADRLLSYLRSVAAERGRHEFDIPFDRQGLADFLCVERSALSAEIGRLARTGILRSRKRHFVLLAHRNADG